MYLSYQTYLNMGDESDRQMDIITPHLSISQVLTKMAVSELLILLLRLH